MVDRADDFLRILDPFKLFLKIVGQVVEFPSERLTVEFRVLDAGNCVDTILEAEMAVIVDKAKRGINLDYCKGCGVCATECPRNAMSLEEEIK